MPLDRVCGRCLHYSGAVLLLVEACSAMFTQPLSLTECLVNVPPAVIGLRKVDQSGILPSWVPVRSIPPGSFKTADSSDLWPTLLNNLWYKTEIALFVPPSHVERIASQSLALSTVKPVVTASRRFPNVQANKLPNL
uniref:Secreted protein n=1 Tax=Cryptomonas curvata TaxID=233186 RepID=A0A7S0M7X5_9CRYP|mmetsp:Transcript_27399/g.56964  ORF Transcript_27399/g.56964 Transcript_27399/m.56964 type:complete len:137 (+) Transcript_27399:47-457(+)